MVAPNRNEYVKALEKGMGSGSLEKAHESAVKKASARKKIITKTEGRLAKFRKAASMAYHGANYHAATSKSSIRRKKKKEVIESPATKAVADKGLRLGNALSQKEADSMTDTRKKKRY